MSCINDIFQYRITCLASKKKVSRNALSCARIEYTWKVGDESNTSQKMRKSLWLVFLYSSIFSHVPCDRTVGKSSVSFPETSGQMPSERSVFEKLNAGSFGKGLKQNGEMGKKRNNVKSYRAEINDQWRKYKRLYFCSEMYLYRFNFVSGDDEGAYYNVILETYRISCQ